MTKPTTAELMRGLHDMAEISLADDKPEWSAVMLTVAVRLGELQDTIKELGADVNALDFSWEEAKQRWHKAEAKLIDTAERLKAVLN